MRLKHRAPVVDALAGDERVADCVGAGVVLAEADAELAHHFGGLDIGVAHAAVDGERKGVVLLEHGALLGEGRGGWRSASQDLPRLAEDPRVADAPARDADGAHTGVGEHAKDVGDVPDIARAEDEALATAAGMATLDNLVQQIPAARADVFLLDRTGVDRDPRDTEVVSRVEDAQEVVTHRGRVVERAAHLDRDGDRRGQGVAHGLEHRDCAVGLGEPVSAAGLAGDLLDRTGKVDVDRGEGALGVRLDRDGPGARPDQRAVGLLAARALFDHLDGGSSHLGGIRAHDLPYERVIVGPAGDILVDVAQIRLGKAAASGEEGAVEQGFGDAQRAAVAAGDEAHGGVGIPGQPGLDKGGIEARDEGGQTRIDALAVEGVNNRVGDATRVEFVRARIWPEARSNGGRWRRRVVAVAGHDMDDRNMMRMIVPCCVGIVLAGLLAGCAGSRSTLSAEQTRPYPTELAREATAPIQVIRRTTHIELTNTTARNFGPSTVWLNGRFSNAIEGFEVGQTLLLDLREFHDQWGDRFRAGGFFATRDPDALVLVEIESQGVLTGLVMVGNVYE